MKKCSYPKIISNSSSTGQKFVDANFHPTKQIEEDSFLFQDVEWIRIEEIYKTPFLADPTPIDAIKQGKLGDCHIVSALISISQLPEFVNNLFEKPISVESGAICVNFHYLGQITKIIVDTYLPFKNGHLIFTRPQHHNRYPYWFCIVEKAYAKLFGSFSSLTGGNSHAAFFRLIGGWPFAFHFTDPETRELIDNGKLFSRMLRWNRKGYPMCCASKESKKTTSKSASKSTSKNKFNIRYDHAYSILKVVKCHGHKLIYMRNTWGKSEWSGRWGIESKFWDEKIHSKSGGNDDSKSLKEILNYNQKDDGNFWINFADFVKYFSSLFVDVVLKENWKKFGVGGIFDEVNDTNENDENVDSPSQISIDPRSMHQWLLKFDKPLSLKCTFEKVGEKVSCFACLVKNGGKKIGSIDQADIENAKQSAFKDDVDDDDDEGSEDDENRHDKSSENLNENDFMVQNFPKNVEVMSFWWYVRDVSEPWTLALCRQKCNKDTSFYLTIYTVDDIHITNF